MSTSVLEKRGHWMLFAFALLLYAPSLANDLTNWDDPDYTYDSPFVKAGLPGIAATFREPFHGAYVPLAHVVLVLAGMSEPSNPLRYHLAQWLLIALSALLLPLALRPFGLKPPVAVLASMLWVAHPFRPESAVWVAGLKDTLSLVFACAAFALYGAHRRNGSALVFALGLLAKASLAPLALFFLALEWRRQPRWVAWWSAQRWLVPSLIASVAAIVIHRAALPPLRAEPGWLTPLVTPWWYLLRILVPWGSRAVYHWTTPSSGLVAFAIAAWLLTLAAVFGTLRRPSARWLRWAGLGATAFLLPLAPFVGLISQVHPVAERYTLYPSLVVCLLISAVVTRLGRIGMALFFVLLVASAAANVVRQREWNNGLSLWESNVAFEPQSVFARVNYAGALGGVGRFGEALEQLRMVQAIDPTYPKLDCFMAMARAGKERLDASFAVTELTQLCALPPSQRWDAAARVVSRRDSSTRVVVEELAFGADRAKAALVAAGLALEGKNFERALLLATQARTWDPSLERALVPQILSLIHLKRFAEAAVLAETNVADRVVAARLLGFRGVLAKEAGDVAEAERLLRQSSEALEAIGEKP